MTFDEWFQSKQGQPYYGYYDFAKDAWDAAKALEREACAKICDESGNFMTADFIHSRGVNDQ